MVSCEFAYTEQLLKRINKSIIKKTTAIGELVLFVVFISAAMLFIWSGVEMACICLGVFVSLWISLTLSKKAVARANIMLLNQKIQLIFNRENINIIASQGGIEVSNDTLEYSAIRKVKERDDLLYIYIGKKIAIIAPKDSFASLEDYEKAVELVNNNYVI